MIDRITQTYTFGRLVALVEMALDNVPNGFAARCIRSPRGYFTIWFKRAAMTEGEHQKAMCEIVNALDAEWVFPVGLAITEQTKAWEGYNRQKATDARALFGQKIAERRKSKGLTQGELSALSGLDVANISKIESGKYNVSVDILTRLMVALDANLQIE